MTPRAESWGSPTNSQTEPMRTFSMAASGPQDSYFSRGPVSSRLTQTHSKCPAANAGRWLLLHQLSDLVRVPARTWAQEGHDSYWADQWVRPRVSSALIAFPPFYLEPKPSTPQEPNMRFWQQGPLGTEWIFRNARLLSTVMYTQSGEPRKRKISHLAELWGQ